MGSVSVLIVPSPQWLMLSLRFTAYVAASFYNVLRQGQWLLGISCRWQQIGWVRHHCSQIPPSMFSDPTANRSSPLRRLLMI